MQSQDVVEGHPPKEILLRILTLYILGFDIFHDIATKSLHEKVMKIISGKRFQFSTKMLPCCQNEKYLAGQRNNALIIYLPTPQACTIFLLN